MSSSTPLPLDNYLQFLEYFDKLAAGQYFYVSLATIGTLLVILFLIRASRSRPSAGTYGSAHFARPEEIRPLLQKAREKANRLVLGRYPSFFPRTVALTDKQQESHVLLVAPTGKGKTTSIIIPGILQEDGHRSLFINDIKRELISKCLGALQAKGYACYILSPTRQESHRYNPLMHVSSMEDAESLADCIVSNTGSALEPFWNNAAKLLITATILHLRAAEPQSPLSALTDMLCGHTTERMIQMILHSPSQLARSVATSFLSSLPENPKLAGSIMADMSSRLLGLQNPMVAEVTSTDEFNFTDFIERPTAFILSIPASDTDRLKWLSAAFSMQLMNYVTKKAESSLNGRLPRPLVFYLDEFANMGVIPHFMQDISLVRSAGIAFILAIQNFAQLQRTYGPEGLDTVLANAATQVLFSGCGQKETEFYSRRMGEHTVRPQSKSMNAARREQQTTTTESEAARPLMTPDELRTMRIDQLLILSENFPPISIRSKPYYQQHRLTKRIGLPARLPYRPMKVQDMEIGTASIIEADSREKVAGEVTEQIGPFENFFLS